LLSVVEFRHHSGDRVWGTSSVGSFDCRFVVYSVSAEQALGLG